MLRARLLWMVMIVGLCVAVMPMGRPAAAQSGMTMTPWRAWLYEPNTREMLLVDRTGLLERLTLPLPAGYDYLNYSGVAVTPDGQTFAYTAGKNGLFGTTLVIFSPITRSILAEYSPPNVAYNSLELSPRRAFSPNGRQLAFGYSFDGEGEGWELVVIGLDTFGLSASLTSFDPPAAGLDSSFGMTPVPQAFLPDGRIAFTLVRAGTDGIGGFDAYLWDPATGAVSRTSGFSSLDLDVYAPTGESIQVGTDSRFPATASDALPFGQTNVLSYFEPAGGLLTPLYSHPALSFFAPTFVMNGAHLVLGSTDGSSDPFVYRLLDRDGSQLGRLDIVPAPYNLAGTRDGFLYMQQVGTVPALFSVDLRDGVIGFDETESALFIGAEGTFPNIMWVGHTDPVNPYFSVESYTRWGSLASGVGGESSGPRSAPASLSVGADATIATTDGDALNMRSGPGTSFAIVAKVQAGTTVRLLEGPQPANGFTWWRVRVPSGQEGWVVESAENVRTLIPGAGSFVPTQAAPQGANPSVGSALAIGDAAYVRLGGRVDALRLRNSPSTGGSVIVLMPNGTPVTVIGGPVNADSYTWWQLRTADGNVGWAVEVIGSDRVLVKGTTPPASATQSPIIAPIGTPDV